MNRLFHAMAYAGAGKVLLFGGQISGTDTNDTWERDELGWTLKTPAVAPAPREGHASAFDSIRGIVVLFGGYARANSQFYGDTWEWDGVAWLPRGSSNGPPPRAWAALTYDSVRAVTVLFGGNYFDGANHFLNDTWEWNGTTWDERTPVTSPPARVSPAMAFDEGRGVAVLYGGFDNSQTPPQLSDTWEWNGANWVQRSTAVSPPARFFHAMAYDADRGRTVMFGGNSFSPFTTWGDTWAWDGIAWTQLSTPISPAARYGHAMAYDLLHGTTFMVGGGSSSGIDTWKFGPSTPDGDMDLTGNVDGLDISAFLGALLTASTNPLDLCHGDFNANGVIDSGDLPGFTLALLG